MCQCAIPVIMWVSRALIIETHPVILELRELGMTMHQTASKATRESFEVSCTIIMRALPESAKPLWGTEHCLAGV